MVWSRRHGETPALAWLRAAIQDAARRLEQ
jgi:hypothetical protein